MGIVIVAPTYLGTRQVNLRTAREVADLGPLSAPGARPGS